MTNYVILVRTFDQNVKTLVKKLFEGVTKIS